MKQKQITVLTFLVFSLLLGCTPVVSSSTSFPLSYSEELSSEELSSEAPSSEELLSSSEISSSSEAGPLRLVSIRIDDPFSYYIVGETFNDIENLYVEVGFSDDTILEVSGRLNYYDLEMKDSDGKTFDFTKPFPKAGKYALNAYYKRDHTVASNTLEIEVVTSFPTELTTKTKATSVFNYSDLENTMRQNLSFPTTGVINGLVIPIEIKDYPFKDSLYGNDYLAAIDRAFNGNGYEDTLYWESVASYYKKTSGDQLNFNFEIADPFLLDMTTSELLELNYGSPEYYTSLMVANLAVDDYINIQGPASTQKFDQDGDGFIDGVIFVYSAPDYGSYYYNHQNAGLFWAFQTNAYNTVANYETPNFSNYFWAGLSFLSRDAIPPAVDAHTFIHETGHLLGLPDYYSYDNSNPSHSGPQGGLAMMDMNIGDFDAFSKMALGWADPYVVTEDTLVTIHPNVTTGDVILLADHWNGTAFDEYILLDLQVPTGLNELDATHQYDEYSPLYFSTSGVRMFHVDARIGEFKYLYPGEDGVEYEGIYAFKADEQSSYYLEDEQVRALLTKDALPRISYDKNTPISERDSAYVVINANSSSRTVLGEEPYVNNRLLSIIGANNQKPDFDNTFATNDFLFQAGDSWSMAKKGQKFFTNVPLRFNNGDAFSWLITIIHSDEESATILCRKI